MGNVVFLTEQPRDKETTKKIISMLNSVSPVFFLTATNGIIIPSGTGLVRTFEAPKDLFHGGHYGSPIDLSLYANGGNTNFIEGGHFVDPSITLRFKEKTTEMSILFDTK